jgi:phage baseplate assembly protein W
MRILRGWQFAGFGVEAFGDDPTMGLKLSAAGALATSTGDDVIRQSLMMLLATKPGERVMRPAYGCPLDRLMFAPNDATTAGLAIHYVRQAVQRWEPRVEIVHLDAGSEAGASDRLRVWLDYRVRASQQTGALSFALDLSGAQHAA